MQAALEHAEKIAPGVMTFWFKPDRPLRFEAGQFMAITIPHANADNRGDMREFSISSSPDNVLLGITISYVTWNSSTYKRALLGLRPGDNVSFAEPMGDFVLPKDTTIPLIFVAAGIGSTPYASIIQWLKVRNEKRDIQLIYTVSQPDEFLFSELWRSYPLDFVPIVSRPNADWHGLNGRLDANRILRLASPLDNKLIYLAGPQSFIEPLFNNLLNRGIPRPQLLLDYFPGY